jgi:hypothetical protein
MTPTAYLIRTIAGRVAVVGIDHGQAEQIRQRGESHIYATRRQAEAVARKLRNARKEHHS